MSPSGVIIYPVDVTSVLGRSLSIIEELASPAIQTNPVTAAGKSGVLFLSSLVIVDAGSSLFERIC